MTEYWPKYRQEVKPRPKAEPKPKPKPKRAKPKKHEFRIHIRDHGFYDVAGSGDYVTKIFKGGFTHGITTYPPHMIIKVEQR